MRPEVRDTGLNIISPQIIRGVSWSSYLVLGMEKKNRNVEETSNRGKEDQLILERLGNQLKSRVDKKQFCGRGGRLIQNGRFRAGLIKICHFRGVFSTFYLNYFIFGNYLKYCSLELMRNLIIR